MWIATFWIFTIEKVFFFEWHRKNIQVTYELGVHISRYTFANSCAFPLRSQWAPFAYIFSPLAEKLSTITRKCTQIMMTTNYVQYKNYEHRLWAYMSVNAPIYQPESLKHWEYIIW